MIYNLHMKLIEVEWSCPGIVRPSNNLSFPILRISLEIASLQCSQAVRPDFSNSIQHLPSIILIFTYIFEIFPINCIRTMFRLDRFVENI